MAQMHIAIDGGWVQIPLPRAVRRTRVYHYTDASGLLGIVGHNELWASSAVAMNDTSEMDYGLGILSDASAARTDAAAQTLRAMLDFGFFSDLRNTAYFFSASSLDDSLGQWLGYGGRRGYSVGIRASARLAQERRKGATPSPDGEPLASAHPLDGANDWYRVVYSRDRQIRMVGEMLDFCNAHRILQHLGGATHGLMIFGQLLPQFKHRAFRDEREVRFIVSRVNEADESYRPGKYGVVPYVKLITSRRGEYRSALRRDLPLPISSVTTGPADPSERDGIVLATRRMLDARGYAGVDVRPSDAPYRY